MKKLLLIIAAVFTAGSGMAQLAKKYVLIEQFTQASCGPCASENPTFKAEILDPNQGKIHHIAYHTSWPGTDPMYSHNTSQSAAMVDYYDVTGVPTFVTLGEKVGVPTQSKIDEEQSEGSPIMVKVFQNFDATNINVEVRVITVGTMPTGTYVLKAAIIEHPMTYATPPGSNGEKYFPNVFRRMLPNTTGSAYTPAAKGDSVVFNYSYPKSSAWDLDSIKTVAYVQNTSTKEVINAGSNLDAPSPITNAYLSLTSSALASGAPAGTTTFNAVAFNKGTADETFKLKLLSDAPADWSATFTLDGVTYSDSAVIMIPADSNYSVGITVTPGATGSVGNYKLTMKSEDFDNTLTMIKTVSVISNVTDLIVSNEGARDWESKYERGLAFAGNATYGALGLNQFYEALSNNYLAGIKNFYYNVGWTFPSLPDSLVQALQTHLNNGGNLFISGQDIAWENLDPNAAAAGYGSPAAKAFFTNYLEAGYVADGTSTNKPLNPFTGDYVFNNVGSSSIFPYHGTGTMYPDQITALGNSEPVFYYTSTPTKIAGIRNFNPATGAKIVYLAVGIEMLTDTNVQKKIIAAAYEWFNGTGCDALNIEYEKLNVLCKGNSTGMIDADLYGGSAYSYSWSNSNTTDSIGGLTAGSYTLTVTDTLTGCTVAKTFAITEPATALAATVSYNSTNNSATANPTGGVTPYTYSWNTGQTTKTISGLTTGTYTVTVTDKNGCTQTASVDVTVTGINEATDANVITVQPNPCADFINLSLNMPSEEVSIEINNILGERVYSSTVKNAANFNSKIDMSAQPAGVYLLNIRTGNKATVKRIIKN